MSGELAMLGSYRSETEAIIRKGTLETEGIPAIVMSDDAGGMNPQLQFTQGVRLMVRQEDLERARVLLGIDP